MRGGANNTVREEAVRVLEDFTRYFDTSALYLPQPAVL